jgi:hypothetical protein
VFGKAARGTRELFKGTALFRAEGYVSQTLRHTVELSESFVDDVRQGYTGYKRHL